MSRPAAATERSAARMLSEYLKAGVLARTIIRDGEVIVEPMTPKEQAPDFDAVDFTK